MPKTKRRRGRPVIEDESNGEEAEVVLNDLLPNPKNPRKKWESDEKHQAFRRSLIEFGDLSGVIRNTTTGTLVGGHKRVAEFREDEGAIISITHTGTSKDGSTAHGYIELSTGVRFAYREVAWPEEKEKLALLAANQWGAEWEWEGVSKILQELQDMDLDIDFSLTGFDASDLNPLMEADWKPDAVGDLPSGQNQKGEEAESDPDFAVAAAMLKKFMVTHEFESMEEAVTALIDSWVEVHEQKPS